MTHMQKLGDSTYSPSPVGNKNTIKVACNVPIMSCLIHFAIFGHLVSFARVVAVT